MSSTIPRVVKVEGGYPVVGAVIDLLRDAPGYLMRIARKHPGEVVGFRLGPVTCYLVTAVDHVQHVLNDHWRDFGKGGMWKVTRPLLGDGLPAAQGDLWRRQRRMMQPLFSASHLASLTDLMTGVIDRELALLAKRGPDAVVDMVTAMAVITQQVLLDTLFGPGIERRDAEHLVEQLLIAFREMNLRVFLYFLPDRFPLPGDRAFRRAIATLDEAMYRLVRARRASDEMRNDLLSRLLHARDDGSDTGMDDRQLRDELISLFVAGNETTATAMAWLCYMLDRNPTIDQRLRAEVADVLGGRTPTHADLAKLTYTRRVFLEALRMYPPVWMVPRFADKDTVIGGYRIPAGSPVVLSPMVSHRDPTSWDNPDIFDPDRFTPERSAGRQHYAYYPFGAGPRKCIGEAFAVMEGQLLIAMLVQRFRPALVPGSRIVPSSATTLKPRHGMKMKLGSAPGSSSAHP